MSRRSALIIGAGVGATVALSGAIYLLWKYSEDEEEEKSSYGSSRLHTTSRPVTIEVRIPADQVGFIIGRGGETIREIQKKTQTRIEFKDDTMGNDNVRIAVIRGTQDEAQLAEILVHQTLANQPRIETLELMIPQSSVGRIIGRNGDTIREMNLRSKCKIDIERGPLGTNEPKKVTLRGSASQISHAKALIEEKILQDQVIKQRAEEAAVTRSERLSKVTPLFLTAESQVGEPDGAQLQEEDNLVPQLESLRANPAGSDDVIEVYVSSIADPSLFYIQKVGPRSIELDKLVEEMTAFYEVETNRKSLSPNEIKTGDLVATVFDDDKKWYRAEVVEVIHDDYDESLSQVEIDFADFGDCQRKPASDIFRLEKEFLKLNFQAVECSMANIKPANGPDWSDAAIDDFERLTFAAQWRKLLARIVRVDTKSSSTTVQRSKSKPAIELIDANSSQDINIGGEMVRLGHAVVVESVVENVTNCGVLVKENSVETPSSYVDAVETLAQNSFAEDPSETFRID